MMAQCGHRQQCMPGRTAARVHRREAVRACQEHAWHARAHLHAAVLEEKQAGKVGLPRSLGEALLHCTAYYGTYDAPNSRPGQMYLHKRGDM